MGKAVTIVGVCLVALSVAAARSQARPAAAVPCRLSQFAVSLGPYVSEATGQHTLALRLADGGGPGGGPHRDSPGGGCGAARGGPVWGMARGGAGTVSRRPPTGR